ncbi:MAG: hypothetical protein IAF02_00750 [Anaerolineae bacterium]|nr:hypothetical protein [Anaerolineae bacterium]
MTYLPINGLPYIEENEATGEVADLYEAWKRDMQAPYVPNFLKAMAASPEMLVFAHQYWMAAISNFTLPQSLVSMIQYTIATYNNCLYCRANQELNCRTLGVDEDTLNKLVGDLDNLNPERVRVIIDFALKVAKHAQALVLKDFELLREQGITDGEIVEIIIIAAMGNFNDTVADALQIDVDNMVQTALDELK